MARGKTKKNGGKPNQVSRAACIVTAEEFLMPLAIGRFGRSIHLTDWRQSGRTMTENVSKSIRRSLKAIR